MSKFIVLLLFLAVDLFISPKISTAAEVNVFSPVVSYQFLNALDDSTEATAIISPVASYQYFEWPGDENVNFQNSASVSYFFSDGEVLTLIGNVRTTDNTPIAGASVSLKRYSKVFWSGMSDAQGNFTAVNVQAASFTIIAEKMGYTPEIINHSGASGGVQTLTLVLSPTLAALKINETGRQALDLELHVPPVPPEKQPKLLVFNGVDDFTADASIFAGRPTVVFAHGWQPTIMSDPVDATEWCLDAARKIYAHYDLSTGPPNIVVWDWRWTAHTHWPRTDDAARQGELLGKALLESFDYLPYQQHLHFIGHSLGTIVNAFACDYLHGVSLRANSDSKTVWNYSLTSPHMTLLDEAELASFFDGSILPDSKLMYLLSTRSIDKTAEILMRLKGWKSPIPKHSIWIDNYISLVGIEHIEAVNVALPWRALSLNIIDAHSYSHEWYRRTIEPSGRSSPVGFRYAVEAGASFPPVGNGLFPGNYWIQNLETPNSLDLIRAAPPSGVNTTSNILNAVAIGAEERIRNGVNEAKQNVAEVYKAGVQFVETASRQAIETSGKVVSTVGEKAGVFWDAASDAIMDVKNSLEPDWSILSSITSSVPRLLLSTRPALAPNRTQQDNLSEDGGIPAYAWITVSVPLNARMMAFDFSKTGNPADDSIVCAVNGQNVFNLPARLAPEDMPSSTDMLDVSSYAGRDVELFFGLAGGTSTDCTVVIDGIRFVLIPDPTLEATIESGKVRITWPAAATGWTLESSSSLDAGTWLPESLDNGMSVIDGAAILEKPVQNAKHFYRLRRAG